MSRMLGRPLLTLGVLGALLCFAGISNQLWTPDEPRVAAIGRAMWSQGSWVTPQLNDEAFLQKPPVFWWAQAAVFALAGKASPALARLPSALFAFGTALLTYALGRRYFEREASLLGALVLLTTLEFALTSHWILVDNALAFAVASTWACYAHAQGRRGASRALLLAGMYASLAAACLCKGAIGLGIPLLGIAVHLAWTRRLRDFVGWHLIPGAALVVGSVGAWLWALYVEGGGESLRTFLVYNQLGRFFPDAFDYAGGHRRPWWYYLAQAPVDWLPWTPFLVLAVVSAVRNREQIEARAGDGVRFCLAASVPLILLLSLAGTKRGLYLHPICPMLALLVGSWMAGDAERARWEMGVERFWRRALMATAVASAATLALPHGNWPWALLGILSLGVFGGVVRASPPATRVQHHFVCTVLVCLAAFQLFLTVKPFVDVHYKSFAPFVAALESFVPVDQPLYAFAPDKTLFGVVGFYTGRHVEEVDLEALAQMAEADQTHWVVVRDRRPTGGNYATLEGSGIPHRLVSEHRIGNRRTLRIVALGALNSASERRPEGRRR